MRKLRNRKPVAMIELWKGTVFDSQLPANQDEVTVVEKWIQRQLSAFEILKDEDFVKYIENTEVQYHSQTFMHIYCLHKMSKQNTLSQAFYDMTHQVAVHSVERARLLLQLWGHMKQFLTEATQRYKEQRKVTDKALLAEVAQLQDCKCRLQEDLETALLEGKKV